jgi:hypothetical protein
MSSQSRPHSIGSSSRSEIAVVLATLSIALVLVVSVIAWDFSPTGQTSATTIADGPTFYQALSELNGSVANQTDGPWHLFTVYGVATPVPFDPNALGWEQNNVTVNSCGAQFNGLTIWNGSIPLFNGSYNSGTAPFWQFMYFSNTSQEILVATDVLGETHVYPPMAMSSPCAEGSVLNFEPWAWAKANFSPLPGDSTIVAQSAWNTIGQNWMPNHTPAFEAYRFGNNYWGSGNPQGIVVNYGRCGEVGAAGVQPVVSVVLSDSGRELNYFEGAEGCGNVEALGPPPGFVNGSVLYAYVLDFSTTEPIEVNGASQFGWTFQAILGNRSTGVDSDASGIVSWMVHLNLTGSAGQLLPAAASACASWVPSLSSCEVNNSGWYAVLLSPSGAWLDSYGFNADGSGWTVPNVSLVSNQRLVVIAPPAWNTSGDRLVVGSTTPDALLGGIAAL